MTMVRKTLLTLLAVVASAYTTGLTAQSVSSSQSITVSGTYGPDASAASLTVNP